MSPPCPVPDVVEVEEVPDPPDPEVVDEPPAEEHAARRSGRIKEARRLSMRPR
jgi:hypothetical protein